MAETRLGRYPEAERHLKQSVDELSHWGDFRGAAASMRSLGFLYAAMKDSDKAREWFAKAIEVSKDDPDPNLLTDIKAQQAMLLHAEGKSADALPTLQECLAQWRSLNHPRWVAKTLLQVAEVDSALNDKGKAVDAANEAKSLYEQAGDRLGVQACQEFLDRQSKESR